MDNIDNGRALTAHEIDCVFVKGVYPAGWNLGRMAPGKIIEVNSVNDIKIIPHPGGYDSVWYGVGLWDGFVEGDYAV
jgi:hypothetical protein